MLYYLLKRIKCYFKGHVRIKRSGRYLVYIEKGYCLRCRKLLEICKLEEYEAKQMDGNGSPTGYI